MKPGNLSIAVLIYFISSLLYIVIRPEGQSHFPFWKAYSFGFYYLIQYGMFFYFAQSLVPKTYYSLDIFSLKFFRIYVVFKFVFFSLLINSDMPTYIKCLDSKLNSLICSISILLFTVGFIFLDYDRYKKLLG